MMSYHCPACGVSVPESDLNPDAFTGQPMHDVRRRQAQSPDDGATVTPAYECAQCGPVAMTLRDKERWGRGVPLFSAVAGDDQGVAFQVGPEYLRSHIGRMLGPPV
jgi:DNA-directed RNA polymerase subunit RPC12/RpoP